MSEIAGIILAGGRSRRMGRDKALLALPGTGERTFVEQLITLFLSCCSEVVLVVRDAGQAAEYTPHLPPSVRVVCDEVPDSGPLMGLYSGLQAVSATHALVTAVDTPLLQPALVRFLLAQPREETVSIPLVDEIPQVLLAVYPRVALRWIEVALGAGRRDPRALLALAPVRFIDAEQLRAVDPQLRSFVNVNTPQDLERLV